MCLFNLLFLSEPTRCGAVRIKPMDVELVKLLLRLQPPDSFDRSQRLGGSHRAGVFKRHVDQVDRFVWRDVPMCQVGDERAIYPAGEEDR
jgi:hypothetical protein